MKINTKPFDELISYLSTPPVEIFAFNDNVIPALKEIIKLAEAVNAMMAATELHPLKCPFCNTEAYIGKFYIGEEDEEKISIGCNNSECLISDTSKAFETKEEAIQKWNTRA